MLDYDQVTDGRPKGRHLSILSIPVSVTDRYSILYQKERLTQFERLSMMQPKGSELEQH